MPNQVEQIARWLAENADAAPLPAPGEVEPVELAATQRGKRILEWAAKAGDGIPETTYTKYRAYLRDGQRPPYEKPYFAKRQCLTQAVMQAWLGQDGAAIDRVNDLLWSICEETNWVLPAHERQKREGDPYIDLFAAETGSDLAHIVHLLGDRLPEEIRERVRGEIERRIFTPFLANWESYWWDSGRNNWTGVCAGSVGETFLLLEDDPARQAQAVAIVQAQLERFIENAFTEEGASLEGIGYWNYGLLHYVSFAEMLRAKTGGQIDILDNSKVKAIAAYPAAVALDRHVFASFSDSHEHHDVLPFLAARLAERTGETGLLAQVGGMEAKWVFVTLRNLLWWSPQGDKEVPIEDVFLAQSGIVKLVGEASGRPVVLAAKAGDNAEPHNNNDVGSFVLRIGGTTYLCDPGGGFYSKDYFSSKRYENVFANSYGHSVPRVGGRLQPAGAQHNGTLEMTGPKSFSIAMGKAYDAPGLQGLKRDMAVREDGQVELVDSFTFTGAGETVEEALITWLDAETDGPVARVVSGQGVLEIRSEGAAFKAERLVEACKANHASGVLTRITAEYPAAPEIEARFTLVFKPAN